MINIKLNPAVFAPGGMFHGTNPQRAVLMLGTGKPETNSGLVPIQVYGPESQNYISDANVFPITVTGVQIYDLTLQLFQQNMMLQASFGQAILDFMQRNLITVDQDGTVLTVAQVASYIAP